ncbi:hypothetical protein FOMPIDRAFT_1107743, partial [Fomitopsis schrenkii]
AARLVIVKIVNALSAMQQIGGPTACAYLLGNPDHYTDQTFKSFYWTSYISYVASTVTTLATDSEENERQSEDDSEHILIGMEEQRVVPYYRVNDYIYRPSRFENMSLYQYLCTTVVRKYKQPDTDTNNPDLGTDQAGSPSRSAYQFQEQHPLRRTHAVFEVCEGTEYVLNFIGPPLPRRDVGDRETYCRAMLVLFSPNGWRVGDDILRPHSLWEMAFSATSFLPEHTIVMNNMNILYECLDARDDYSALRRQQEQFDKLLDPSEYASSHLVDRDTTADQYASQILPSMDTSISDAYINDLLDDPDGSPLGAYLTNLKCKADAFGTAIRRVYGSYQMREHSDSTFDDMSFPNMPPQSWSNMVQGAKENIIRARQNRTVRMTEPTDVSNQCDSLSQVVVPNDAFLVTNECFARAMEQYRNVMPRSLQDSTLLLMHNITSQFTLNDEQLLAFGLIARHLHHHEKKPLRMYLGGIGGTGKSTVVRAVCTLLTSRGERYRFLVLAPTGSAACNVDGQTYHSALGLRR